jgi:hypothetical protein
MRRATALVTLLLLLTASALGVRWAFDTSAAAPTGNLTCSVKASCDAEEVEVFRMSSTANAHAGTTAGSGYGYSVCCGGVVSLATSCSGLYETVLTLSAADNAHVASDGSYPVGVCLSVSPQGTLDCTYGATCDACLATISDTTNAHVADCDGADDYATKVCCQATSPLPVGGVAELADTPDSSGRNYMALAGLAAAALLALTAGAWYARRRLG